jgi:hypothetical protein
LLICSKQEYHYADSKTERDEPFENLLHLSNEGRLFALSIRRDPAARPIAIAKRGKWLQKPFTVGKVEFFQIACSLSKNENPPFQAGFFV